MNKEKFSEYRSNLFGFVTSWKGAVGIIILSNAFLFQPVKIPSVSMDDTLLPGDSLIVNKLAYGLPMPDVLNIRKKILPNLEAGYIIEGNKPKRGDIVVFNKKEVSSSYYIKRIVAKEKDIIFLSDKDLYVNYAEGEDYMRKNFDPRDIINRSGLLFVKNPYKLKYSGVHNDKNVLPSEENDKIFDLKPYLVEKDKYFMMGDNRDHSYDSRYFGTVDYNEIVGRASFSTISIDSTNNIRWNRFFSSIDTFNKNTIN